MADKLPGWAVPDRESVRDEAAPYLNVSPEVRLRHLKMACRAGVRLARMQPSPARAFGYREPLPESTVQALKRLRARSRRSDRDDDT